MVINEYVEVTGNPKNYKRYIELGYDIKINEKIFEDICRECEWYSKTNCKKYIIYYEQNLF